MADLFDYLAWRGDLTCAQAPWNDVDNLILSKLSYLPFDGLIPGEPGDWVVLADVAERFLRDEERLFRTTSEHDPLFLTALSQSERFRKMRLSGYVNRIDPKEEKQFSAVIVEVEKNFYYIAYRGTDCTFVGWKEDFNMSFMTPVPAQKDAVSYLEKAARALDGRLMTGGHSKGGNLAVFAAAFCDPEVQKRIVRVYNNDGPGFDKKIISQEGFDRIGSRVRTFVPQSSVVGMLLEHEENYTIVHSTQIGILQHDLYSWEVLGSHPVCLDTVTSSSRFIDLTLKEWISDMSYEQREQFTDALFAILEQTGAKTFKELSANWYENSTVVLKSIKNMDDGMRQVVAKTLLQLFKCAGKNLSIALPKPKWELHMPAPEKWKGILPGRDGQEDIPLTKTDVQYDG